MTEAEWLASMNPSAMLHHLGERAEGIPLRLFALECCRRIWPMLGEATRRALEYAEQYCIGRGVSKKQLKRAHDLIRPQVFVHDTPSWEAAIAAQDATSVSLNDPHGSYSRSKAGSVARYASMAAIPQEARVGRYESWAFGPIREAEQAAQAHLVRCLFAPAQRALISPAWLTADVRALLTPGSDAPSAILADALEEAGCTSVALLAHLRSPLPHARTCGVAAALRDLATEPATRYVAP